MIKTIYLLDNAENLKNKKFICVKPVLDLNLKDKIVQLEKREAECPYWVLVDTCKSTVENLTGFELWKEVLVPMDFKEAINSRQTVRSEFWDKGIYAAGFKIFNILNRHDKFDTTLKEINGKWYAKEVD